MKYRGYKSFSKYCKKCIYKKGVKCRCEPDFEYKDKYLICYNLIAKNESRRIPSIIKHLEHVIDFNKRVSYSDEQRRSKHEEKLQSYIRSLQLWKDIFNN